MGVIENLLQAVPLPRMAEVSQRFDRPKLENPAAELGAAIRQGNYFSGLKPRARVAVAVGSRGITNLPEMVKRIVDELTLAGAIPFIVPAMGSHAGATAEGQRKMLEGLGIHPASVGADIVSSMDVTRLGTSPLGLPVFIDANAAAADGIVMINRIKPHVCFRGPYESGIMKMIAIGLGKQAGADFCHRLGFEKMPEHIPDIARTVIGKANILCAIGVIENAYHETARIALMRGSEISGTEPILLKESAALCGRLYLDNLDVLIIDEVGKDISGAGFDTNVVGRYHSPCISGGPRISRLGILDISRHSNGNGNGLGMADFISRRAREKFSGEQTYPNTLTATLTGGVKMPMTLGNDRLVIQACIKVAGLSDMTKARVVRIKNTLCLDSILVSESLLEEVSRHDFMKIEGPPGDFVFDGEGNLLGD